MSSKGEVIAAIILTIMLVISFSRLDEFKEIETKKTTTSGSQYIEANGLQNAETGGEVQQQSGTEPTEPLETEAEETEAPETTQAVCYELTANERDLIERVVMAEAGHESIEGQKAVAQCILNACCITGNRPDYVVAAFKYTQNRPDASDSVKMAVSVVFDEGEKIFSEAVLYFYNPALVSSYWHESQRYVCTIGNHKFFERY